MNLNDRELATVLAALRHWQKDPGYGDQQHSMDMIDIASIGGTKTCLSVDEIDHLCGLLNLADIGVPAETMAEPIPLTIMTDYRRLRDAVEDIVDKPDVVLDGGAIRISAGHAAWLRDAAAHLAEADPGDVELPGVMRGELRDVAPDSPLNAVFDEVAERQAKLVDDMAATAPPSIGDRLAGRVSQARLDLMELAVAAQRPKTQYGDGLERIELGWPKLIASIQAIAIDVDGLKARTLASKVSLAMSTEYVADPYPETPTVPVLRTDEEIVAQCNELALEIAEETWGLAVIGAPRDYRTYDAMDPRMEKSWRLAVMIFERFQDTPAQEALDNIRGEA